MDATAAADAAAASPPLVRSKSKGSHSSSMLRGIGRKMSASRIAPDPSLHFSETSRPTSPVEGLERRNSIREGSFLRRSSNGEGSFLRRRSSTAEGSFLGRSWKRQCTRLTSDPAPSPARLRVERRILAQLEAQQIFALAPLAQGVFGIPQGH